MLVLFNELQKRGFKFLGYKDISEYIEDIVTILVYSTWYFTEDRAREQCEDRKALIERCFKKKVPADDCAMGANDVTP